MKTEPAVVGAAVAVVLNIVTLVVFGHELDRQQETFIVGLVTGVAGLWVRSKVTPVP